MNHEQIQEISQKIKHECRKVIVGHEAVIEHMLASVFCGGHCLLIGVPGLAKTLLVQTLAQSLGVDFGRIQFTPDLMPTDILGSEFVKDVGGRIEMEYRQGPIFTQLLLADEINRTPPKTQSALLEAMQEKRVTIAGKTYDLPKPFWVVATQNPIEQEGTYPLPEAQLDRFMFSLHLDYTSSEQEVEVLRRTTIGEQEKVLAVTTQEELAEAQTYLRDVPVSDQIMEYAVKITSMTRPAQLSPPEVTKNYIEWGAGPRASQYLILGAKAYALMEGRPAPEKKDVNKVVEAVLQHRILVNYRATGEGLSSRDLIKKLYRTKA